MRTLVIASLLFSFSAMAAAFKAPTTINVVKCSDQLNRVLILDKSTGLTGAPGMLLAQVLIDGKAIGFPQPVATTSIDSTFDRKYEGGAITVTITALQHMDIPSTQVRGTLQLKGDAKATPMLCNKGPAFDSAK